MIVQRLLALKFGPLDQATLARLAAADGETLLVWGERVLTAASLAAVFENPAPPEATANSANAASRMN